jgi:hypothetical protein
VFGLLDQVAPDRVGGVLEGGLAVDLGDRRQGLANGVDQAFGVVWRGARVL